MHAPKSLVNALSPHDWQFVLWLFFGKVNMLKIKRVSQQYFEIVNLYFVKLE